MNTIKYKITRFDDSEHHEKPNKIVGFLVFDEETNNGISHETIITGIDVLNKTPEECVDVAFRVLSSSIAESAKKLLSNKNTIVGAYYIPS